MTATAAATTTTMPFGPRLIGETEKTLNAVLGRILEGTGLDERQWVTLRLADQLGEQEVAGLDGLAAAVAGRAHFADADALVRELTVRGLLAEGRLTPAGRELVAGIQARIADQTAPIWADLPDADVAVTARVLNEVLIRARRVLA